MGDFQPINQTASSWGDRESGVVEYDQDHQDQIVDLFMGRTVTKVDSEHLLLDDGTVVKAIGHDGGCACSAGCYDLSVLNRVDNVITKVEFDYRPAGDDDCPKFDADDPDKPADEWTGCYRIFVLAGDERINLMQFDGIDGNGYYGTGYSILVRPVTP